MAGVTAGCCKRRGPKEGEQAACRHEAPRRPRELLVWHEAPQHLRHNPHIRSGYRGPLAPHLCLDSVFWWTNETLNVWTHVFGWMLNVGLMAHDLWHLDRHVPLGDRLAVVGVLLCGQVCMLLSCVYHTFLSCSERAHQLFLTLDLLGITLCLMGLYLSGLHYALWCDPELKHVYQLTQCLICCAVLLLQWPRLGVSETVRTAAFLLWSTYGMLPIVHLTVRYGGWGTPMVRLFLPRMLTLYGIGALAFFFYASKVPERFFPGRVDYVGSSHQLWHLLVVLALYHYHNTGMLYVAYRMNHGCYDHLKL